MPRATTSSGSLKDKTQFDGSVSSDVKTISLGDILAQVKGFNVALLKLDCEGCEWGAVAAMAAPDFEALFGGRLIGEVHFLTLEEDPEFVKRSCYGDLVPTCCKTYSRLCSFERLYQLDCMTT